MLSFQVGKNLKQVQVDNLVLLTFDQFAFFFYELLNSEKGYRVEPSIPIVPGDYVKSRSLLKSSCQAQCKKSQILRLHIV